MTNVLTAPDGLVEVFWRPGCPYCFALRRDLARLGVIATWRNIWEDAEARAFVCSVNAGAETVPTVRVGSRTLTNPRGAQVAALLSPNVTSGQLARPLRPRGRRIRVMSWTPTLALVVVSELVAARGHGDVSWALDGLAITGWWLTRPLRR